MFKSCAGDVRLRPQLQDDLAEFNRSSSILINETATETACNSLLEWWKLTVADFVVQNDKVDDVCDDLAIGQPVRYLLLPYTVVVLTHAILFNLVLR